MIFRVKFFIFLVLCTISMIHSQQNNNFAHGRSILDKIPGAELIKDLTYTAMDSLNSAVNSAIGMATQTKEQITGCFNCQSKDPDVKRNVSQIITSRGFIAKEYDVVTKDGYILTIQRIVNPLIKEDYRDKMKPVIMQHGLMSSSVDWVINSVDVKPQVYPIEIDNNNSDGSDNTIDSLSDSQEHPNSLGFYLANRGYDVFLANSRGNIYGQKHVKMSAWEPKFWDFTFDEQIKYDLPDVIEFVQKLTNHTKVGYVGHSQGTAMMFGLLSDKPEYSEIVEPFIALAPVAYVNHAISPVKYFAVYTPIAERINMWFATSNIAVKYLVPFVCKPEVVRKDICANIVFLSVGFNEEELDESRIDAYLNHMPSGTSVKNIAHYGQEVLSGRFAHFDHGILGNQLRYGQQHAPIYDLTKINSKSIVLFIAENDWLASPKDVAHLRSDLKVEPFAVYNITREMPKWNHIDFVYGKHAGELVNTRIEQVFEHFRTTSESN